ncbi:branched-chain amino acid transport system II carrier protein [Neobacillus sp. DY30]|uniref:branched-chain amino acid transport system II carrier protein n=1 Tax=Neobacillus sp. DY30 TaxID=3047871 RepID=UPI0024BFC921|nr:branched-chain amino acid transport system II carrier protein [Neobacillus sp. DY30]WHX98316.1 branched-chain amino acid transport system II carrier protein [Neobacillus sp. DY30]
MKTNNIMRDSIIFGFAFFAVFFGAGNLIFPPSIGFASGSEWPLALVGFVLTGIVLPLLALIAVLNAGGKFENLTNPISPWFHKAFNLICMVFIAMLVTVPRTAATTHEIGVRTLFPDFPVSGTMIIFFGLNYYFAMDKSNLLDKVGKFLTPALFAILVFIVLKGTMDPIGEPIHTNLENSFSHSFLGAYQTGDVFTGLLCASVFIASIVGKGYTKSTDMRKIVINGTVIAGMGLLIVYGGLLYLGAEGSGLFSKDIESTALLTRLINQLLGDYGTIALAVAVALACLTTAIGITAAIADFLSQLTKNKVSYKTWVILICISGVSVGLIGVEKIISFSLPLFLGLYPVSILLVFLGIFRKYIPNAGAYKGSVILTVLISIFETLGAFGMKVSFANVWILRIPLSEVGFAWLLPAIIGFIAGAVIHTLGSKNDKYGIDINSVNNE